MLIKFDKRAEAEDNECVEQFMLSRKPYRNATTGVKRFAVAMRKEHLQNKKPLWYNADNMF